MARNRHRTPNPNAIADALDRMTAALAAGITDLRPLPSALIAPEPVPCRYLAARHLGMWVEIPGRPNTKPELNEPSILTVVGELVGIRRGDLGQGSQTAGRVLVIRQGGEQSVLRVAVDAAVIVYPKATR